MKNLVLKSTLSLVSIMALFTGCGDTPVPQTQKQAAATYQKFLAEKANGDLDKELEKAGK